MSGRIVGEVLDNAPDDLRPAELLVLIALAEDARDRDRLARFSDLTNLTRRTRLGPGTIKNALSELAARALIKPVHEKPRRGLHQEWHVAHLADQHRHARVTDR